MTLTFQFTFKITQSLKLRECLALTEMYLFQKVVEGIPYFTATDLMETFADP